MAQIITAYNTNGLFKADVIALDAITESGAEVTLEADLTNCADSVIALIDVPAGGESEFVCIPDGENGKKEIAIPLTAGSLNIVRFTTMGIKNSDGTGRFKLVTDNSQGEDVTGFKICFVKYCTVLNH